MTPPTRERTSSPAGSSSRRQGLSGTGLKQVVAEAQAPFGSLYHHFPGGKQQLGEEVVRVGGAFFEALVVAVYDAQDDAAASSTSRQQPLRPAQPGGRGAPPRPFHTAARELPQSWELCGRGRAKRLSALLIGFLAALVTRSLLDDGAPVHVVQDGLGHSDLSTTGR